MKAFYIEVPNRILYDLEDRLKYTRWTDRPEGLGWKYGTNPDFLEGIAEYWKDGYDWRKQEEYINQFPHYKTSIEGITIHFIYVKGEGTAKSPLLLSHGWPDSFCRFLKVIPFLASFKGQSSFDLIIPSIPGFGFSQQVALNTDRTAVLFNKLMQETLGFTTYFAAGGDLGTLITKSLAVQFPESVKAIHLTDVGYPDGSEDWSTMSPEEQQFGSFIQNWMFTEGGYNLIQSTKPQTLGYALNDSPVGLASWILEKFYAWSDHGGNLENSFSKDELITNIMIYWVTQSINSSIRTYAENAMSRFGKGLRSSEYVTQPTGISLFPNEGQFPKAWADRMANVTSLNIMNKGGHFAPMEVPEIYASEVREFFLKN